jgi:trehalose synthase-fused probable maltokinase
VTTASTKAAIIADLPTIDVDRLGRTLTVDGLAALGGRALLAYLGRQRWFGAKGAVPSAARVVDVVPLPWDDGALAIAIVDVDLPAGTARYQMPLAMRRVDASKLSANASTVVARVHAADGDASLFDALYDPVFQQQLGQAFAIEASFESPNGGRWSVERISKNAPSMPAGSAVRVGSAEQSNSALIFDRSAFLKLFRKLEGGVQPDVEVIRFLNLDAGFHNVPALFGTITYRDATAAAVAGMLQEFLPESRDAWDYILGATKANPASAATAPDIELLGRVTRELHDALSGDAARRNTDFAPLRAAAVDVERWAQRTKEMIRQATTLLERQRAAGKLAEERAVEAEALVRRRDHYLAWIEEVADLVGDDAGAKIRIHGDYHLGQVLRTKSDSFVIIDFEGEPTRALAERREKTSPLRDVAGMLRSLAYAAATLVQPGDKGKSDARSVAERELIAGRWERDARASFLRGYTGQMKDDAGLLPVDPKRFDALLSLFEAERTFYELGYELNHRPGWEWIPMRGISRLLVR